MHEKLPDIIDALIDGLPPQGVCEKIGMCNSTIGTTTPGPEPDGTHIDFLIIKYQISI